MLLPTAAPGLSPATGGDRGAPNETPTPKRPPRGARPPSSPVGPAGPRAGSGLSPGMAHPAGDRLQSAGQLSPVWLGNAGRRCGDQDWGPQIKHPGMPGGNWGPGPVRVWRVLQWRRVPPAWAPGPPQGHEHLPGAADDTRSLFSSVLKWIFSLSLYGSTLSKPECGGAGSPGHGAGMGQLWESRRKGRGCVPARTEGRSCVPATMEGRGCLTQDHQWHLPAPWCLTLWHPGPRAALSLHTLLSPPTQGAAGTGLAHGLLPLIKNNHQ